MLRVAGGLVRSARASSFHSDILQRSSHANTLTARGIKLRVVARQQQQRSLLLSRASRHDRVLTASLGLVSGGIIVTSVINKQEENRDFKGVIGNLYGDANDLFYRQNGRQFDEPWFEDTNKKAVAALIAANTLVFGLWRVSFRNARLHQFMWRHFASSYDAVVYGKRFHTLLTSAFSHITFPHFGINMFMLWEFGPHVLAPSNNSGTWYNRAVAKSRFAGYVRESYSSFSRRPELLSIEKFMALYFTSAMTSSALSALVSKLRGNGGVFSIGASGAVSAVFTVSCLLFPDQRLLLYGIFDMTSAQMLQLYTALNIVGAAFQRNLRVDCVGHLGGQGAGFAFQQAPLSN
ncbi:hypothetical protein PI124_g1150 [Phytophthora idaei]|uniref:Peptidase S54 rhomboid domain-containing protein n=1 Tax=Phytophthora aleatoria TaxID=2496075 RepID=A0A8J5IP88_9STRA|nr:hypothetical protein PI125_g441 [Phytophthora idaei]KAG3165907.1 hypothetical protein PI126_g4427 [Phytophthora idaei]KAG3254279.1 hypothetical protein PI124_g1150 [Phytophthora idaei]KAG6960652.1 hypothetical protein JG688_00009489 [Phytophthora aleatoria]